MTEKVETNKPEAEMERGFYTGGSGTPEVDWETLRPRVLKVIEEKRCKELLAGVRNLPLERSKTDKTTDES